MLAPRHLIFTALEGALVDPRTDSFTGAEEALGELARRQIPYLLLTSRTREQIESVRAKLEHIHPFITENGGGIFIPDGYFNLRIPGAVRMGRYLGIAQGRPYPEVCAALDGIAEDCGIGVAGFHHMALREIAGNTRLSSHAAERARAREFDEPFFFTSADDQAIARFVETANERGFTVRRGSTFWHFCSGCDPARAVRLLAQIFRDATRSKLRLVGIGGSEEDLPWLHAMDVAILLPNPRESGRPPAIVGKDSSHRKTIITGNTPGPAGWNEAILSVAM